MPRRSVLPTRNFIPEKSRYDKRHLHPPPLRRRRPPFPPYRSRPGPRPRPGRRTAASPATPATAALWTQVITALNGRTPEAAAAIPAWSEDFLWLLTLDGDAELASPREAAVQFINSQRQPFQPECSPASLIYFQYDSNVNDWVALWGDDSRLNYLGYGQG